jgi:hypothetical protein
MEFLGKIGHVNHHLFADRGNAAFGAYGYDQYYQSESEGWPYINMATCEDPKYMRVKFYIDEHETVAYYVFDFGDGKTEKTIDRECSHAYDLSKKDEYLINSGTIPIQGMEGYTGRWANVTLTRYLLNGTSASVTKAFIYEIDTVPADGDIWQCIPYNPYIENIQCTVNSGEEIQVVITL